jgi:acyl-CoA synthetase (AMP-forming)/AMP-acid ligase II
MRIIDCFDRGSRLDPDRICLVFKGSALTYREVATRTHAIAWQLRDTGLCYGDRVGVLGGNSDQTLIYLLAALRAGLVWVPLNAKAVPNELGQLVALTECDGILYGSQFASLAASAAAQCPRLRVRLCMDQSPAVPPPRSPFPATEDNPDSLAAIFPSGGTTGAPKAVMWPQRVFECMTASFFATFPAGPKPVHLVAAPVTHAAGVLAMMMFSQAATQIILPRAEPLKIMEAIARHRVTHLFLPPTVIYMMLAHQAVGSYDYSSLRNFIYSAAPMSTDKLREALKVFGPVMTQVYGQVEAPLRRPTTLKPCPTPPRLLDWRAAEERRY